MVASADQACDHFRATDRLAAANQSLVDEEILHALIAGGAFGSYVKI
jgi:hypothetical protein